MVDEPRLLTRVEAAAYCGFKPSAFSSHVAAGRLPQALPGLRKWDRKALDAHLDKLSGIVAADTVEDDPWAEYERTKAQRALSSRYGK